MFFGGTTVPQWDSEQYLKFERQRTRPARDLAAEIAGLAPGHVLDVGCGPGNSTAVLRQTFAEADILGVDSSPEMIERARERCPGAAFRLFDIRADLTELGRFDVVFSNACLQWIDGHEELIGALFGLLNPGGVLAVQMPQNEDEPFFKLIEEVTAEPRRGFADAGVERSKVLAPERYFDILSRHTDNFDIWQTVYRHPMGSVREMVEWVKGSRLKPYLDALGPADAAALEQELAARAKGLYPVRENGQVVLCFKRLFFTAVRT